MQELDLTDLHEDLSFARVPTSNAQAMVVWICRFQVTRSLVKLLGRDEMLSVVSAALPWRLPVARLNWLEAVTLCQEMTDLLRARGALPDGMIVRLPREIEWEEAVRAGTSTTWHFGDDARGLERHAWYEANSGGREHPVGAKLPNPLGLHDVYGNVAEWCLDVWSPAVERKLVTEGNLHVVRGGACDCPAHVCTSSWREPCDTMNSMKEMTGLRFVVGHPAASSDG